MFGASALGILWRCASARYRIRILHKGIFCFLPRNMGNIKTCVLALYTFFLQFSIKCGRSGIYPTEGGQVHTICPNLDLRISESRGTGAWNTPSQVMW